MKPDPEQPPSESWLEKKLAALNALYTKFGTQGFRDQPLSDVNLLLVSKELQQRDAPKHNLTAEHQAANRQRELEIGDIRGYMKSQVAGLSLADLRSYRPAERPQQQQQFKHKNRDGMER
jgi:hypothetical protein